LVTTWTIGKPDWRAAEKNFRLASTSLAASFRLQRHGRHGGIEMAAMKIYSEDGRNDFVDSEIHSSFSFVSQRGRFNNRRRPDDLTYASFKELTS
jgi:hypothetical protein